jgi:tRNA A64-2'-O-ribosylphosphate transferase
LKKPLRPFWVTLESGLPDILLEDADSNFYPVVCCTASRQVRGSEAFGSGYIQGAGDDSESWAHGLTPEIFWQYRQTLLETSNELLFGLIQELVVAEKNHDHSGTEISLVALTRGIYLGTIAAARQATRFDAIISCVDSTVSPQNAEENPALDEKRLDLICGPGKLGSRALRNELCRISPFITALSPLIQAPKILVVCPTGRDLAVGAALVVICQFINDDCKSFHQKTIDHSLE